MSKFKVGDKVVLKDRYKNYSVCNFADAKFAHGFNDTMLRIIKNNKCFTVCNTFRSTSFYVEEGLGFLWDERFFELVQEKFTFEEVIARIKEGEVYENNLSSISKIDGCINVTVFNDNSFTISKDEDFTLTFKSGRYKLVPQKKEYQLYEVEHQEGGKRYLFRSMLGLKIGKIVVCDTRFGKTYGRIVDSVTKELTEEEYKAYKLIIKSV